MAARLSLPFNRSSRFWRSAVGLVAAYAIAFQGILVGLAGAQLAATTYDHAASGFELCLNDTQNGAQDNSGSPIAPAIPQHLDHCVFCFASAHHDMGAPAQSYVGYGGGYGTALAVATASHPSYVSEYSIARPRGPPISA
jgi:hypothetical protein